MNEGNITEDLGNKLFGRMRCAVMFRRCEANPSSIIFLFFLSRHEGSYAGVLSHLTSRIESAKVGTTKEPG